MHTENIKKSTTSMDSSNQDHQDDSSLKQITDEKTINLQNEKSKNFRHRKKQFYNSVRQQMEFYFGDANLSKDRFLMKLIKEDPFVPLEIFLKFNKLKKLTNSIEDIAKAISNSTLLELDDSKTKVRRRTEILQERNVDEKTIYVESLPLHADHDWVIKVFSRYGPVAYVSLPRYKKSRKIKEFGFVEFESMSSVERALKAFKEFDGVLYSETLDPSNLMSVTSFVKEQNEMETSNVDSSEEVKKDFEANKSEISDKLKRKKENESSDEENDLIQTKKSKMESEGNNENEEISDQLESENEEDNEDTDKKKKNRKHRKRKSLKMVDETDFHELKILSKRDWKRLRNKYLNMQREKFKEFKKMRNRPSNQSQKVVREPNKVNLKQQTHSVNFYCASESLEINSYPKKEDGELESKSRNESDETQYERNIAEKKEPLFHFESGLIVRIKFIEPCVDIKSFKADMTQYNCIKYVDVKEGAFESFLRCDNSINAEKLIKQISCAEYQCQILTGNEEEEYWKKIMKDREMKLNKKVKVKQKRGREKIVKALAKHIRFDDDNE